LGRTAGEITIDEAMTTARGFRLGRPENLLVQRRQRTGRIGIGRPAGQRERLTAAAAKIDFLELAALTWLGHPVGAAIAIECFRMPPDPRYRMIAHGIERKAGDGFRSVARQYLAGWRDIEEL